jgi:hypothetical protein
MTFATLRSRSSKMPRLLMGGRRLALAALLGVAVLAAPAGSALAQTAGTAGAAPAVAPVITSAPPVVTSPGVLSAAPQATAPGVLSAAPQATTPGVLSAEPPGVGAGAPRVAGAPVVMPAGMPMTGDGSLADQFVETGDGD